MYHTDITPADGRIRALINRAAWHRTASCLLGGRGSAHASFPTAQAVIGSLRQAAIVSNYFAPVTSADVLAVYAIVADQSAVSTSTMAFNKLFTNPDLVSVDTATRKEA